MGIVKTVRRQAASQRPREQQSETTETQPMRNQHHPFLHRQGHTITPPRSLRGTRPGACARAPICPASTHITSRTTRTSDPQRISTLEHQAWGVLNPHPKKHYPRPKRLIWNSKHEGRDQRLGTSSARASSHYLQVRHLHGRATTKLTFQNLWTTRS